MKILMLILGMALAAADGEAQAETPVQADGNAQQQTEMRPAGQAKYSGYGVFRAVQGRKVQIAHGPIPELQWPAMTMWFALRDTLPQDIRVGDSVRFELIQAETKQWVIIGIERH